MQYIYKEVLTQVLNLMGLKYADLSSDTQLSTMINKCANQIQSDIGMMAIQRNCAWMTKQYYFPTEAEYTTGTISATRGSSTITGSGTSWADKHKEWYIEIENTLYKIKSVAGTTSLTIEGEYGDSTVSGKSYRLVKRDYKLPRDLWAIKQVRLNNRDLNVYYSHEWKVNATSGEPHVAVLKGIDGSSYYSTGTVSSISGTTVTLSGSTLPADIAGRYFRVDGEAKIYEIASRTDGTHMELSSTYDSSTSNSGTTYKIDPPGAQLLAFDCVPDKVYNVCIDYYMQLPQLINDNDVSYLPDHDALIKGLTWLMRSKYEQDNATQIAQDKNDYEQAKRRLCNIRMKRSGAFFRTPQDVKFIQDAHQPGDTINPFN